MPGRSEPSAPVPFVTVVPKPGRRALDGSIARDWRSGLRHTSGAAFPAVDTAESAKLGVQKVHRVVRVGPAGRRTASPRYPRPPAGAGLLPAGGGGGGAGFSPQPA